MTEMRAIIEQPEDRKLPDLLLERHPTVQAFVDKKVSQARESLKGFDETAFLQNSGIIDKSRNTQAE